MPGGDGGEESRKSVVVANSTEQWLGIDATTTIPGREVVVVVVFAVVVVVVDVVVVVEVAVGVVVRVVAIAVQ